MIAFRPSSTAHRLLVRSFPPPPPHLHPSPPIPNSSLLFHSSISTSARKTATSSFPLHSPPAVSNGLGSAEPEQEEAEVAVEEAEEEESTSESDSGDGIEIEIVKVGRNRRRISARVGVAADLETVWGILTDYEGLAEFIPSLAVSHPLEKGENFARLYQVGQQNLALGLKFDAKVILDCYEKDLELLPSGRKRDIEFKIVEGDFQTFEGTWSIVQNDSGFCEDKYLKEQEFQTELSYLVELEPKLWLPVHFLEGRLCREVRTNLACVREEAQRVQRAELSAPSS